MLVQPDKLYWKVERNKQRLYQTNGCEISQRGLAHVAPMRSVFHVLLYVDFLISYFSNFCCWNGVGCMLKSFSIQQKILSDDHSVIESKRISAKFVSRGNRVKYGKDSRLLGFALICRWTIQHCKRSSTENGCLDARYPVSLSLYHPEIFDI